MCYWLVGGLTGVSEGEDADSPIPRGPESRAGRPGLTQLDRRGEWPVFIMCPHVPGTGVPSISPNNPPRLGSLLYFTSEEPTLQVRQLPTAIQLAKAAWDLTWGMGTPVESNDSSRVVWKAVPETCLEAAFA